MLKIHFVHHRFLWFLKMSNDFIKYWINCKASIIRVIPFLFLIWQNDIGSCQNNENFCMKRAFAQ